MINLGIVGVGNISGIYLKNITETFKQLNLVGVCDLIKERAIEAQKKFGFPKVYDTMYDLFNDESIDLVLNITRPAEHFEVSKAALLAGKHVYSEKPLGASLEEGIELVNIAKEKNLYLGGAPDTFLGASIQTCRKIIDDGEIGDIIGVTAFMTCHGHENWHPDPFFLYGYGGGPMFDMGPYYITAFVNLIGGIKSVTALTKITFPERKITSQPFYGETIHVTAPTHISGLLLFKNGAIGNITTSFDVYNNRNSIEIYGTKGTLFVPDPNCFDGEIKLYDGLTKEEKIIPSCFDYSENSRAIGLTDMARSIETGRVSRASYIQTLHVLEVMDAFDKSSKAGKAIEIKSKYEKQPPMNPKWEHGFIE